jgi:hypothetical protein
MEININPKGIIGALLTIARELKRIADCMELELAEDKNLFITPPVADVSGEAPEIVYVDEEDDYIHELEAQLGARTLAEEEEEEETE